MNYTDIVGEIMNLLILFIGIIIGILIAGSIFVYVTLHNDNKSTIRDMKNYIDELERENTDLKARNKRLKEALRKT